MSWIYGLKLVDSTEYRELTELKYKQRDLKIKNIIEIEHMLVKATKDIYLY